MCVCVCVCVCVCNVCVHVRVCAVCVSMFEHVCISPIQACHACLHHCTCILFPVCVHTCTYLYTCTCACMCVCACTHPLLCVSVCLFCVGASPWSVCMSVDMSLCMHPPNVPNAVCGHILLENQITCRLVDRHSPKCQLQGHPLPN